MAVAGSRVGVVVPAAQMLGLLNVTATSSCRQHHTSHFIQINSRVLDNDDIIFHDIIMIITVFLGYLRAGVLESCMIP